MSYSLVKSVLPDVEPISLAEAKVYLRVDHDTEDDLITALISAARSQAEHETGRVFITQTLALGLMDFPRLWPWSIYPGSERLREFRFPGRFVPGVIDIPVEPVQSVSSLTYYDPAGSVQTLVENTNFLTWLSHSPPLAYCYPGTFWPLTQIGRLDSVTLTFVAGYGGADDVPYDIKAAIYLTLAYWYENRGDGPEPASKGLPSAALRLLRSISTQSYS